MISRLELFRFILVLAILLETVCRATALDGPVLVGAYPGDVRKIAVQGNYVFSAGGNDGLSIIDVSDRTAPKRVGGYNPGGGTERVAASGSYVYVGVDSGYRSTPGVHVVDVHDPTKPKRIGIYTVSTQGGAAFGFTLASNYLYLTTDTNLTIVDITNPQAPRRTGVYHGQGSESYSIALAGNYAFTERYPAGLQIIDVSIPGKPAEVATYKMQGFSRGVAVAGHYVYLGDSDTGSFHVIDVSNPATPAEVGTYETGTTIESVAVAGSYAFISNRTAGLQLIDVSEPTAPSWAGAYYSTGAVQDAVLLGEYVYVADGLSLQILKFENPSAPVLQINGGHQQAIVSWPAAATGFTLEVCSQLGSGAVWSASAPVGALGDRSMITNTTDARAAFFRLRKK
jgi:hypothetical protein